MRSEGGYGTIFFKKNFSFVSDYQTKESLGHVIPIRIVNLFDEGGITDFLLTSGPPTL